MKWSALNILAIGFIIGLKIQHTVIIEQLDNKADYIVETTKTIWVMK